MPRYFFHVVADDEDGTELPDDTTAREQARETFGTMIRDGDVKLAASMEVLDDSGRQITVLRFSAEG